MSNKLSVLSSGKSPLRWVFFVSVIANLFLIGILASGVWRSSHHAHFGPMALSVSHGDYMVDWMVRYLDKEDAAAFRESVKSQGDALKQAHDQVRKAITDVSNAYQQDPHA